MHVLARKDSRPRHAGTLPGVDPCSTRQRLLIRLLGCCWLLPVHRLTTTLQHVAAP